MDMTTQTKMEQLVAKLSEDRYGSDMPHFLLGDTIVELEARIQRLEELYPRSELDER